MRVTERQTDEQTYRHADYDSLHSYHGWSKREVMCAEDKNSWSWV